MPDELMNKSEIDYSLFRKYFKSSKNSGTVSREYYDFYISLKEFRESRTLESYDKLLSCLEKDKGVLQKAFGYGKQIFNIGNKDNRYDIETFINKNLGHRLLTSDDYNREVYVVFSESKWIDGIKEYSDTTIRMLSATGLFKFKNLPQLSYPNVLSFIFDINKVRDNIFGEISDDEYGKYEFSEHCYLGKNTSLIEILGYSKDDVSEIISKIEDNLKVRNADDIKLLLNNKKNTDFIQYINEKYPKEKIMELLPMFSDRRNDLKIKKEVNDAASVPTIYEFIIGIAWYYISNKEFDLYSSLNLTLNADFEPVIHAGGGDGDIVIYYNDITVMLEVTMMNKQAQKRGEWEPVLRHSLNLKASSEPKETVTFFVADELDYNTVNIWRAVAAVSLESTNTHRKVNGVVIMPFTNRDILKFLEGDIYYKQIVKEVKSSFANVPQITDVEWHEDIVRNIFCHY
jgi:hypothetical protein